MHIEFLPPYSPNYNPIELTFSAMEYYLCRNGEYAHLAMTELGDKESFFTLSMALYEISAAGVFGWYHQCGYV